jgi:hypothetical protein
VQAAPPPPPAAPPAAPPSIMCPLGSNCVANGPVGSNGEGEALPAAPAAPPPQAPAAAPPAPNSLAGGANSAAGAVPGMLDPGAALPNQGQVAQDQPDSDQPQNQQHQCYGEGSVTYPDGSCGPLLGNDKNMPGQNCTPGPDNPNCIPDLRGGVMNPAEAPQPAPAGSS